MAENNLKPVVIEQHYVTSAGNVWQAITDLNQMKKWFFEDLTSFKPEVGFKTKFGVEVEGIIYTHLWEITELIPLRRITYNWKYEGFPGDSYVTFDLIELNNSTQLILTHTIIESFQLNNPIFSRQSTIDGWTYFIKESLKRYLEKAN